MVNMLSIRRKSNLITPARKITNTKTKKNIGRFFSLKMHSGIWYESLLERDYMYLLEIDPDVLSYCSQPLKIAYKLEDKKFKYTPDFFVERNQKKQIVEIKPKKLVNSEKNTKLFQCIDLICQSHKWEFLVITDEMIRKEPLLSNIKLLYRYALVNLTPQATITCHEYFQNQSLISLQKAEENLSKKGIFRDSLFKLIFTGFLSTDLTIPIGNDSLISLTKIANH